MFVGTLPAFKTALGGKQFVMDADACSKWRAQFEKKSSAASSSGATQQKGASAAAAAAAPEGGGGKGKTQRKQKGFIEATWLTQTTLNPDSFKKK